MLINVLDHEGDLVAVAREHDARLAAWMKDGDYVAVAIGANLVRKWAGPGTDNILHRTFKTGRAGGEKEVFEKRKGGVVHESPQKCWAVVRWQLVWWVHQFLYFFMMPHWRQGSKSSRHASTRQITVRDSATLTRSVSETAFCNTNPKRQRDSLLQH
jgi:hypothetical protein